MLPQENFVKLGTLRSLLSLGQKATRISPSVVSVAREAVEPNCKKRPPRTMRLPNLRVRLMLKLSP